MKYLPPGIFVMPSGQVTGGGGVTTAGATEEDAIAIGPAVGTDSFPRNAKNHAPVATSPASRRTPAPPAAKSAALLPFFGFCGFCGRPAPTCAGGAARIVGCAGVCGVCAAGRGPVAPAARTALALS